MSNNNGTSAPPQYSADGRWWWDGEKWVAVPPPPRQDFDWKNSPLTAVLIIAVAILGLWAWIHAENRDAEIAEQNRQFICERWGEDDPSCY